MNHLTLYITFIALIFCSCGSSGSDTDNDSDDVNTDSTVNTQKLIGTPLEGLEIGDTLDPDQFLCNQYQTLAVHELPIKVFAAFFTNVQEETVQDAIDIINAAASSDIYQLTDIWSDDIRLIYRARSGLGSLTAGKTSVVRNYFNNRFYADGFNTDWVIGINAQAVDWPVIAHELGHAVGIVVHQLVDFENNTLSALDQCSVMASDGGCDPPAMDEFNFMVTNYTEIMMDHFGELGATEYPPDCNPGNGQTDKFE